MLFSQAPPESKGTGKERSWRVTQVSLDSEEQEDAHGQ